jgi:hypothetical protein
MLQRVYESTLIEPRRVEAVDSTAEPGADAKDEHARQTVENIISVSQSVEKLPSNISQNSVDNAFD